MSIYSRTTWENRNIQYPKRGTITLVSGSGSIDSGDSIEIEATPGTVTTAGTPTNQTNMNNIEDFLEVLNRDLYRVDDVDLTYTGDDLTNIKEYISTVLFRDSTLTYSGSNLSTVNVIYYDLDGTTELLDYTDTLAYTGSNLTGVTRVVN